MVLQMVTNRLQNIGVGPESTYGGLYSKRIGKSAKLSKVQPAKIKSNKLTKHFLDIFHGGTYTANFICKSKAI